MLTGSAVAKSWNQAGEDGCNCAPTADSALQIQSRDVGYCGFLFGLLLDPCLPGMGAPKAVERTRKTLCSRSNPNVT